MSMGRTLKVWNGHGYCCEKHGDPIWQRAREKVRKQHRNLNPSLYLCAYSRADAIRMIHEYTGFEGRSLVTELRDYFSQCWGNAMKGITPERGIWLQFDDDPVIRVFPNA